MKLTFMSDNTAPADTRIIEILSSVGEGYEPSYGYDSWTVKAEELIKKDFGAEARFFPVLTGTGANVIALSSVLSPYQSVICADTAHINVDECGAPERFLGSKIVGIKTEDGKLCPADIEPALHSVGFEHHSQPRVISVSQVTETGLAYTPDELKALADFAKENSLLLHIDGSRMANAAVYLNCSLAEAVKGADIISFGGTKNGMMMGEAVIVLNPEVGLSLKYFRKQGMQLFSKMRYVSAQFVPYLQDGIWLENARHANKAAKRLSDGILAKGYSLAYPLNGNGVFAKLSEEAVKSASEEFGFYVWDEETGAVRLMCSFATSDADIDRFLSLI